MKLLISQIFENKKTGYKTTVEGWVKTKQAYSKVTFLNINDGSGLKNLQVLYKKNDIDLNSVTVGSALKVSGEIVESKGSNQTIELLADNIEILAIATENFPIQKKNTSFDYLRSIPQQRSRTKTFQAISIIRHECLYAIHTFFRDNNFYQSFPPILTTNNCEGGSDVFGLSKESNDFFKNDALLTVSGQFYAEALALGLKNVYVLSPTFRAEKSNSVSHLAEFWMLEIEMSFAGIDEMVKLTEKFLKSITSHVLKTCKEPLNFLSESIENNKQLVDKLEKLVSSEFKVIEYAEAISILQEHQKNKNCKFINEDIKFGVNLASEHERYLCERVFNSPIAVINYPKEIKAFYMKQNVDNKTVSALDILVPGVGELIGGSERETRIEKIKESAKSFGIDISNLNWYLDLRKFGYYKSSGFGLGFERLLMYFTGMKNIKDLAPFPRSYKSIDF